MKDESILYDMIPKRKSVRRYHPAPLEPNVLAKIRDSVLNVEPLFGEIGCEWVILDAAQVKSVLAIRAPHYLCLYSAPEKGYLMNAGYVMQQADLYLASQGLGRCFLGMAKPNRDIPRKRGSRHFVMMLAFGLPAEPLHRSQLAEFKRKPLQEISSVAEGEELMKIVRLAPSAVNVQPWYFVGDGRRIDAGRLKKGPLLPVAYDRLRQIDMGIALCYLGLAARNLGKTVRFAEDQAGGALLPENYMYAMTAYLN
ncbi:MAG: nitroreductase family protein [Christensenellales bacterium]|jgi:nitroreductase